MPGMGTGLNANNPTIVDAFKSTLLHQGLIAVLILLVLVSTWQLLVFVQARRAAKEGSESLATGPGHLLPDAPGRRLLRVAFGLLWIFDGFLQAQPKMPVGMTTGVIQPAAAASPSWVQHVVNAGATIWSFHPIEAPASAVWIQIGIGLWLLVAPRGRWSRAAGAVAAGWGLVVWVFGEAFGGIFPPGLTWLFGAPGAVLFYVAAGVLVALPERSWASPRLGRTVLGIMGLFFVGMATLQAWPGRGFWHGRLGQHRPATLVAMVQSMAKTPQPHLLSSWISSFAAFVAVHGFAVNLFVVIVLGALGLAFLAGRTRVLPYAVVACCLLCLADWVLVEDLGFVGGVGTDPNSMIPLALVVVAGYLGVTKVAAGPAGAPVANLASAQPLTARLRAASAAALQRPTYLLRSLIAIGTVGIVALGAVPMALASTNPNADPIIAAATNGTPGATDYVPKDFHLVDQFGRPVSLRTLRGKTVALTFLDPVCVYDCPIIASEFRTADQMLGPLSPRVEMVAVVANPLYRARSYVDAFDRQEYLTPLTNWLFLTGSTSSLRSTWSTFGVQVAYEPGGTMIAHSDVSYVLDGEGHVRMSLSTDPGSGTEASQSSFAVTLANAIRTVASES